MKFRYAFDDLVESIYSWQTWHALAWQDIRQRYRRSVIGPFWLSLGMGINIACIGVIWGNLFGFDAEKFIPYLTLGLIFWEFITNYLSMACAAFYGNARFILQIRRPYFIYILWTLWRQILILFHNFLVFIFVAAIFSINLWPTIHLVPLSMLLLAFAITPYGLALAILSSRYRDVPPILTSILGVLFFVSPILWSKEQISGRGIALVEWNPMSYVLDVVRGPFLGIEPEPISWVVFSAIAGVGWVIGLALFVRFRHRIAYWI